MQSAAEELLSLGIGGLQLTPGLVPTEGFQDWLEEKQISVRTHHGFSWRRLRAKVWSDNGDCVVNSNSIHPPLKNHPCAKLWDSRVKLGDYHHLILETMYPEYCLGNGEEVAWAMDLGLQLAVDVSHVYIQLCQGAMSENVWRRLQEYEGLQELHVSSNTGSADIHQPITKDTFGLDWVKERSGDGIPVILECYLHKLSLAQRTEQVEQWN
ncbi:MULTISPECIES: hypothetical protein [Nostocales]|uniref:Xylose isomerase-like TIM barrel domain-containing protein n=3 Tax=Nostocales TaxID=1161 RepID=A0A0C1R8W2_9CYAN|nr:hypothetical protein [Tolypothrix bouteillei]KAF3890556.1 hypothetical protein DA73_0400037715 [Tolypothrix bouteillei VB521301]